MNKKLLRLLALIDTTLIIVLLSIAAYDIGIIYYIFTKSIIIYSLIIVHWVIVAIFIWHIFNNKILMVYKKIDNSLMIIFFGSIGMWVYLYYKTKHGVRREHS